MELLVNLMKFIASVSSNNDNNKHNTPLSRLTRTLLELVTTLRKTL